MITLHAYRIQGQQESVKEVLSWIRHITFKEFKTSSEASDDVIIIILKSDFSALEDACKKRVSVSFELCGAAEMAIINERPTNKGV
jgi:hypothetical protein